nr:MAG TPA: hypothetical protein [Caudoviricetes sp.]
MHLLKEVLKKLNDYQITLKSPKLIFILVLCLKYYKTFTT